MQLVRRRRKGRVDFSVLIVDRLSAFMGGSRLSLAGLRVQLAPLSRVFRLQRMAFSSASEERLRRQTQTPVGSLPSFRGALRGGSSATRLSSPLEKVSRHSSRKFSQPRLRLASTKTCCICLGSEEGASLGPRRQGLLASSREGHRASEYRCTLQGSGISRSLNSREERSLQRPLLFQEGRAPSWTFSNQGARLLTGSGREARTGGRVRCEDSMEKIKTSGEPLSLQTPREKSVCFQDRSQETCASAGLDAAPLDNATESASSEEEGRPVFEAADLKGHVPLASLVESAGGSKDSSRKLSSSEEQPSGGLSKKNSELIHVVVVRQTGTHARNSDEVSVQPTSKDAAQTAAERGSTELLRTALSVDEGSARTCASASRVSARVLKEARRFVLSLLGEGGPRGVSKVLGEQRTWTCLKAAAAPYLRQIRKWLHLNGAVLVSAGSVLSLTATLMTDMSLLRAFNISSSLCFFVFNLTRSPRMWAAAAWNVVFLVLNAGMLWRLYTEHRELTFSSDELDIFEKYFLPAGLSPRQYRRLLRLASWHVFPRGRVLQREGEESSELHFVVRGSVQVLRSEGAWVHTHRGGDKDAVIGLEPFLERVAALRRRQSKAKPASQAKAPTAFFPLEGASDAWGESASAAGAQEKAELSQGGVSIQGDDACSDAASPEGLAETPSRALREGAAKGGEEHFAQQRHHPLKSREGEVSSRGSSGEESLVAADTPAQQEHPSASEDPAGKEEEILKETRDSAVSPLFQTQTRRGRHEDGQDLSARNPDALSLDAVSASRAAQAVQDSVALSSQSETEALESPAWSASTESPDPSPGIAESLPLSQRQASEAVGSSEVESLKETESEQDKALETEVDREKTRERDSAGAEESVSAEAAGDDASGDSSSSLSEATAVCATEATVLSIDAERLAAFVLNEPPLVGLAVLQGLTTVLVERSRLHASRAALQSYDAVLAGVLADGVVKEGERQLLEKFRKTRDITPAQHEEALARLGWTGEEFQRGVKLHSQGLLSRTVSAGLGALASLWRPRVVAGENEGDASEEKDGPLSPATYTQNPTAAAFAQTQDERKETRKDAEGGGGAEDLGRVFGFFAKSPAFQRTASRFPALREKFGETGASTRSKADLDEALSYALEDASLY